jgi:hypothetical protein
MKRKIPCKNCGSRLFDLKHIIFDDEINSGWYLVCRCCDEKVKKLRKKAKPAIP